MTKTQSISLITALAVIAGYGITSWGQTPEVQYHWTEPTTGSPVAFYRGELTLVREDTTRTSITPIFETTYSLEYQWGTHIQFRVAAVDSQGRQGPWSVPSAWWVDDGPPGAPGPVQQTLVLE